MWRWVKTGVEGEAPCADIMEIRRPDDLVDVANLGLTLAEAKRLLAGVQREIVAAQAGIHAVRRPDCSCCGGVCRMKDHRDHAVATLFGEVTVRLPRFRCAVCDGIEAGLAWPLHCRSTPGLDRLQAHLSAVMSDRTAADVVGQMFSVDAGTRHETLRRPTLKVGEALGDDVAPWPDTAASAIVVTLDATFIRRCADGERHLEVRVGNGETASAGRQVFGAVAKADTDILPYRQTEGLLGSVIAVLGLSSRVPDHTTLSRRAATLDVPRLRPGSANAGADSELLHLLVDSTGLKLCGAGEWLHEKHGTKLRRSWRKLHLGMDAGTGRIVACTLTTKDVDDASQASPLSGSTRLNCRSASEAW